MPITARSCLFAALSCLAFPVSAVAQPLQPASPSYAPATPVAHHLLFGDDVYRSPGLAVALSLTPVPVDFGNLYAENLGWGIAYTSVELSLMAPMMWIGVSHMNHGGQSGNTWSDNERFTMVGLVAGYVAVKLAAGVHAGYAAADLNRRYTRPMAMSIVPAQGGAVAAWQRGF